MEFFVMALMALGTVAVVAVFVLLVVLADRARKRVRARRQALARHAHHRDWDYVAEDPSLVDRFSGAPFGRGHGRRALNVLTGRYDGRSFVAFDYQFHASTDNTPQTNAYAVVALHLGTRAPDLAVGPTTTLRRWVDSLTGRDIEIGDPAFDAHFTVHSPDPRFAADVLRSDVRDVLRHHPQVSWRITGDSILVVRPGAHGPGEIEASLHMLDALLDRIPRPVWDRLHG